MDSPKISSIEMDEPVFSKQRQNVQRATRAAPPSAFEGASPPRAEATGNGDHSKDKGDAVESSEQRQEDSKKIFCQAPILLQRQQHQVPVREVAFSLRMAGCTLGCLFVTRCILRCTSSMFITPRLLKCKVFDIVIT